MQLEIQPPSAGEHNRGIVAMARRWNLEKRSLSRPIDSLASPAGRPRSLERESAFPLFPIARVPVLTIGPCMPGDSRSPLARKPLLPSNRSQ